MAKNFLSVQNVLHFKVKNNLSYTNPICSLIFRNMELRHSALRKKLMVAVFGVRDMKISVYVKLLLSAWTEPDAQTLLHYRMWGRVHRSLLDWQRQLHVASRWCYKMLPTLFSIRTAGRIVPFPWHKLSCKGNVRRNFSVELISHSLVCLILPQLQYHISSTLAENEKGIVTDHL